MPSFFGHNKFSTDPEKETEDFSNIFKANVKAAQKLKLTPADVSGEGWDTSVPKLIDNAIIGLSNFDPDKFMAKINTPPSGI
jgi:hypothetical protein